MILVPKGFLIAVLIYFGFTAVVFLIAAVASAFSAVLDFRDKMQIADGKKVSIEEMDEPAVKSDVEK